MTTLNKERQEVQTSNQSGMALITVLFVFAIASVLAVSIATASFYSMQITGKHLDRSEAGNYLKGGEVLTAVLLKADWEEDNKAGSKVDSYSEDWGKSEHKFSYDEGEVKLSIRDLQARFNVNSLVDASGSAKPHNVQRFKRLLASLNISIDISDKLVDWLDGNQSTNGDGAEDISYLGLERPHRTGDYLFSSVSEVNLMLGLEKEDYKKLAAYLSALPGYDANINVNNAGPQVLASLTSVLDVNSAEAVVEKLKSTPISDPNDLKALTGDPHLDLKELTTQSDYFDSLISAEYLEISTRMQTAFQRDPSDGAVRIVSRNYGIPFKSQEEK